jgi:hypothetical protein
MRPGAGSLINEGVEQRAMAGELESFHGCGGGLIRRRVGGNGSGDLGEKTECEEKRRMQ